MTAGAARAHARVVRAAPLLRGPTAALLRRIALGLPLVAVPALAGCSSVGSCDPRDYTWALTADETTSAAGADGVIDMDECVALCSLHAMGGAWPDGGALPPASFASQVRTCMTTGSPATMSCRFQPICRGRRPAGLLAVETAATLGGWLAENAHLEAASVPAFLDLARELELHGAPTALASACRRAAVDEVRHARAIGGLAIAWGTTPPPVRREVTEPRDLEALLLDDVVEGCVHEALGALVASHQSQAASEGWLRAAYAEIAADEARHALLSFAIADWASERTPSRVVRRADETRRRALFGLATDEPPAALSTLGLPSATRSATLTSLI